MEKGRLALTAALLFLAGELAWAQRLVKLDSAGVEGMLNADAGLAPLSRETMLREFPEHVELTKSAVETPPSTDEPGHTSFRSDVFGLDAMVYQSFDGKPVFEGDMVIGTMEEVTTPPIVIPPSDPHLKALVKAYQKNNGLFGFGGLEIKANFPRPNDTVWHDGIIPYCLIDGFSKTHRDTLQGAIDKWNLQVGLIARFTKKGDGPDSDRCPPGEPTRARVRFVPYAKEACLAEVGRFAYREQYVWIHERCTPRQVLHELAHVAGMLHEHTRNDRDKWVTVVESNIATGFRNMFFQIQGLPSQSIGDYDYSSLLHYSIEEFTRHPGEPTLLIKYPELAPPLDDIGRVAAFSKRDIDGLNEKYRRARQEFSPNIYPTE